MSKAKRQRTNPTGLVDIEKDDMTINISQDFKSGALEFYRVTKLELESYNFPNDALLIIHATFTLLDKQSVDVYMLYVIRNICCMKYEIYAVCNTTFSKFSVPLQVL